VRLLPLRSNNRSPESSRIRCAVLRMGKDKTPAECTQMCVKDGMKYALAVEKKVYTLEGHEAELSKLAGQRVMVKGTLKGDTLSVREVAASK
jgi:hypothetical protein